MFDNIFIMTCGGLGDQVCAEPVVREVRRMWPNKRVGVVGQRAFFGHLDVEVFGYESDTKTDGETFVVKTFQAADWGLSFVFHPVDFISMSVLRRQLPNRLKQIRLRPGFDRFGLKDHLLIHPGKTWENRTFPQDWWQNVVDLCSEKRKCALIGSHIHLDGHNKGLVDIECPPGCVDLRNQTTIEELIVLISGNDVLSNDSFPVHIAGAFDNWIFMIPTAKHPEFVLPFRNGRQDYKSCCPLRRLMSEDMFYPMFGLSRGDTIPEGFGILDYLPSPEQVVEAVTHCWKTTLDGSILWCK